MGIMFNRWLSKHNIREVTWFSRSGESMPNGNYYQRGGFITECRQNERKFITEGIAGEQYGLKNYRGGIIVFATSVNSNEISKNKIVNKAKQMWTSFVNMAFKDNKLNELIDAYNEEDDDKDDLISAFTVTHSFKGEYLDLETGKMFNDRSYSIEIGGLSSKGLLNFAEKITNGFLQQTVLVKDFNTNKIYLADGVHSDKEPV